MNLSEEGKTSIDDVGRQRLPIRLVFLALPFGFGLLLLIAALVVLTSASKERPSSPGTEPAALVIAEETPVTPTSTPHTPSQSELPHQSTPTQVSTPADEVVAQVNGQTLDQQVLQTMQAADRAMAALLGQSPSADHDVLDRLVNGELVWQAAQAAGFALDEGQVDRELRDFLSARSKSAAELESALAANGLSADDFRAYFGRLLVVDQFSRAQAQAQGITISAYVQQLQHQARISFGPAAQMAVAQSLNPPQATSPEEKATPTQAPTPQTVTHATAQTPTPPPADVRRGTGIGQYAPLFDLPVLNYPAADFLTLGDLAGKPTLLSFWTTWCPYCRAQTPVLVDAHARYGERVQFVGINVKENQQTVQSYVNANGMRYPIALDFDGKVAGRYDVSGFPTTYFLDAEGRVVVRHVGQLSSEKVDSYLQQLLGD